METVKVDSVYKKKVLIIDAHNMMHIARFGLPDDGNNQIAYNFLRKYKYVKNKFEADEVYFVVDGAPEHRNNISNQYKANRKKKDLTPEEVMYWENFKEQKKLIIKMMREYVPCHFAHHPFIEGDDVVYYIAKNIGKDSDVTIVSSDTDFIQVLNELSYVKLWNPVSQKYRDNTDYDYVSWKSMVGDTSDNIKGVRGIGKVRATKIMKEGSLISKMSDLSFSKQFNKAYSLIKLRDDLDYFKEMKVENNFLGESQLKNMMESLGFSSFVGDNWPSFYSEITFE